jgi:ABC-type sugar transport system ATPase subunit
MYAAESISKRYGSTQALTDVRFSARPGDVHALVGMNGAGKSTLVRVLVGVEQPDQGSISLDGKAIRLSSSREALSRGIAVVAQDLNVFPALDVLANLFLLREPRRRGLLDVKTMLEQAEQALAIVGLDLDPRTKVGQLPQSDRQRVAIARAMLFMPRVLVLDEPTSALQPREKERLLDLVRELRASGTAIVYVSHFLEEVFSIADRVTVLRDGSVVTAEVETDQTTLSDIVRAMSGTARLAGSSAAVTPVAAKTTASGRVEPSLRVAGLTRTGHFTDVTLDAHTGEILGLAGLEGAGAASLLAAIFGCAPADSGSVVLPDGRVVGHNMSASVRCGLAYVPADRHQSGVMTEASIMENLMQVRVSALGREGWFLWWSALAAKTDARVAQLGIKIGSIYDRLSTLSGGNQQKVLIGKWLEADARVYLLDDPTAGIDVHAREEIHAILHRLADAGNIVIVNSSDPEELLRLCDRVAILYAGRVTAVVDTVNLTAHDLLEAVNTGIAPTGARGGPHTLANGKTAHA